MANGGTWYRGSFYPKGTPTTPTVTISKPTSTTPQKTDVQRFNESTTEYKEATKNLPAGATDVEKFNAIQEYNKTIASKQTTPSTSPLDTGITPKSYGATTMSDKYLGMKFEYPGSQPTFKEKASAFAREKWDVAQGSVSYFVNAITPNRKVETPQTAFQKAFTPSVSTPTLTGMQGTAEFKIPTYEQLTTPEQKYAFSSTQSQVKAFSSQVIYGKELGYKYQEKVDLGEMNVEDANKAMKEEMGAFSANINQTFKTEIGTAQTQYLRGSLYAEAPYNFLKGLTVASIGTLLLPIGYTLGAVGLGYAVFHRKEIAQQFKMAPLPSIVNIGSGIAGGFVGGFGVSALKVKYENFMFGRALSKTPIKVTSWQYKTERGTTFTKFETTKPFTIRGMKFEVKGETILPREFSSGRTVGEMTLAQRITGNNFETIRIYKGVPTLKSYPSGTLKAPVMSYGDLSYFGGKSSLQLIYQSTTTKYFGGLIKRVKSPSLISGKFPTAEYSQPFKLTRFGGTSTDFEIGLGREIKGFTTIGGKLKPQSMWVNTKPRAYTNVEVRVYRSDVMPIRLTNIKEYTGLQPIQQISISQQPAFLSFPIEPILTPISKGLYVGLIASTPQSLLTQTKMRTSLFSPTKLSVLTKQVAVTIPKQTEIPKSAGGWGVMDIPAFAQEQTPKLVQPSITLPAVKQEPLLTSLPFTMGGVGFPFILPKFPFDFGQGVRRLPKKKQRKKYTPDYPSLILGIKGKQPKGIETGIRLRPIPPKFSWAFGRIKL